MERYAVQVWADVTFNWTSAATIENPHITEKRQPSERTLAARQLHRMLDGC
jgi:hypothetical protein